MTSAMMEPVRVGHFTAWCDGYRAQGHHLVFLSLFGVQQAVRALWATVVGRSRPSIEVGNTFLSLEGVRYSTLKSLLSPQMLHLTVTHPNATALVSPFNESFLLLSEKPAEQFWSRFSRMCVVPMRPTWRDEVWKIGVEKNLITALDGAGPLLGYRVDTGEAWAEPVRDAIKDGRLR